MLKKILNTLKPSPIPYRRILEECREEDFTFKFFQEPLEHTVHTGDIEHITTEEIAYKYDEGSFKVKIGQIREIQTLPKSKRVNIFFIEKSSAILWYFAPAIIGFFILTYGTIKDNDILIGAGGALAITFYFTFFVFVFSRSKRYKQKLLRAIDSSQIGSLIDKLEKTSNTEDYFNKLITVNLKYMDDYYNLVQMQTSKSYSLTRMGAIVGFFFLIVGIAINYFPVDSNSSISTSQLSIISGLIIEFISAVFFYLYNRTIRQLNVYHDKLVAVQDTTLALKVAQSIDDKDLKNKTMRYLTEILTNKLIKNPIETSEKDGN